MTFEKLKELIKKHNVPTNVKLLSDSGWECNETDMDGVYYNEKENHIIFTQDFSIYNYYHDNKDYKELKMTSKEVLEILVKQANERKLSNKIVANGIAVSLLEELVDRDTPKKIEYDDFEEPCCPVCGEVQCPNVYATNNNGCPYCLQRLDWGNENE